MIVSDRVRQRMEDLGLSQSELARRVGVAQPTIYKLLRTAKKGSTKLHVIARELQTTPSYLSGETDDPDANAPPPPTPPRIQFIRMDVALPSTNVLAEMFEGLLLSVPQDLSQAELARELAELLPTGLSQLRGLLPATAMEPVQVEAVPALATDDREQR